MSSAVKIFQGRFGRVALLDMDAPLVGHAHPHCHIIIKTGGADSSFTVHGERAPLTDDSAVLVNAWEHHAYEHDVPPGAHTLVLALYIEPAWLAEFQHSLALSGHPRFFPQVCVHITPTTRKIAEEFVHREIFEPAMAGMEARAALALEAHIRATPDLLLRATPEGQKVLPA